MSDPFYITTAIAYPNGDPHVGHAYEYIATDAVARFKRLDGYDVRYLTGTDVHGLKMAEAAKAQGVPTAELARRNSDVFQRLQEKLNISFDRFIRTSDADHYEASKAIWQRMNDAGDIYLDSYKLVFGPRRTVLHRGRDHRRRRRRADRHRDRGSRHLDRGGDVLLPVVGLRRPAARPLRGPSGVHRTRDAAQRDRQLRLGRAAGPVDIAHHVRLGVCRCPTTPPTTSCTCGSTR